MPTLTVVSSGTLTRKNVCAQPSEPGPNGNSTQENGTNPHTEGVTAPGMSSREKALRRRFREAQCCPEYDCARHHEVHSCLDLQLNHFKCWPRDRRVLLEKLYNKVTFVRDDGSPGYWNNLRSWKGYDEIATIVALSTYVNREAFCNCGFHGYSCGDRLFCPRCCYKRLAEPALREFRRAFHADNECYYIVFSLSSEADETKRLIFKDLTKSEMEQITLSGCVEQHPLDNYGIPFMGPAPDDLCRAYWSIFRQVIHKFTGRGKLFSGSFGGPELSVRFLPLAVLPHANYIAWSSGLCSDDVRRLRRAVRNKLRGSRTIPPGLYPKVSVYRIQAKADYKSVIKYIFKPIDLGFAYGVAAEAVRYEKEAMQRLNFQANRFLEDVLAAFDGVHRITRFGFCSASSDKYVGVVTPERHDRREKDAVRRNRKREEANEIRKIFPDYKPHKRTMTKEQRDQQRLNRRFYQRMVQEGELPDKAQQWRRKSRFRRRARRLRGPENGVRERKMRIGSKPDT